MITTPRPGGRPGRRALDRHEPHGLGRGAATQPGDHGRTQPAGRAGEGGDGGDGGDGETARDDPAVLGKGGLDLLDVVEQVTGLAGTTDDMARLPRTT